jgi:hypothetical protein
MTCIGYSRLEADQIQPLLYLQRLYKPKHDLSDTLVVKWRYGAVYTQHVCILAAMRYANVRAQISTVLCNQQHNLHTHKLSAPTATVLLGAARLTQSLLKCMLHSCTEIVTASRLPPATATETQQQYTTQMKACCSTVAPLARALLLS